MLFHAVGMPKAMNAIVATQFPELTPTATGESFPNDTPDGVVAIGTLENHALFSIQIEGGKRNNDGLQIVGNLEVISSPVGLVPNALVFIGATVTPGWSATLP